MLIDEVDRTPATTPEGNPVDIAIKRTTTFHNSKIILVSSPTDETTSRIHFEFQLSDQRYFHVKCPHCRHEQTLDFNQVKWQDDTCKQTHYECVRCLQLWTDAMKNAAVKSGRWIATNPSSDVARI